MRPVLFEIPLPFVDKSVPVHGYGLLIVLGFLLATWVAGRESRRRGLPDFAYDFGLAMLLCGLLGARVFYFIENYSEQFAGLSFGATVLEFFKVWKGGLVFYGGAIGGVAGGLTYLLVKRLPVFQCLDIAAIGTPIGMAFGRLGCFMNGCCYGKLCAADAPLALRFPQTSGVHQAQVDAGLIGLDDPTLEVLPTQLLQAGHDFILFGLVFWYLRRPSTPLGAGMPLLFLLYAIGRFCLEGLRGDNPITTTQLTISQNVSLVLAPIAAACLVVTYVVAMRRRKNDEKFSPGA